MFPAFYPIHKNGMRVLFDHKLKFPLLNFYQAQGKLRELPHTFRKNGLETADAGEITACLYNFQPDSAPVTKRKALKTVRKSNAAPVRNSVVCRRLAIRIRRISAAPESQRIDNKGENSPLYFWHIPCEEALRPPCMNRCVWPRYCASVVVDDNNERRYGYAITV